MKQISVFLTLVLTTLSVFAEAVQTDTIYYDKDWKGVSSPHFATFFRVVEKNPVEGYRKLFRDYFMTGELQSEGGYISIDRYDDSKSIMDGEWINYFRSGKIEQKGNRVNGKQEGEYIRYYFYDLCKPKLIK